MDSHQFDLLDFLDRFDADRSAGLMLPLRHYLERYPHIEQAVAREYLRATAEPEATGSGMAGTPEVAASAATDAPHVGPFRLLKELGRGGQGAVHLAEDRRVHRLVAVKVLAPETLDSAAVRARFRREAQAIARLEHPSLCRILEADLEADVPYIAMRYVEGETLRQQLQRARSAPSPQPPAAAELTRVLRLFERLARALHAAHEAGIVHRDIKPGNIQIDRDGLPVLLDFGLARFDANQSRAVTLTAPGQAFGTPAYMAPEQHGSGGDGADRRADIYALGVTLYECLTLTLPTGSAPLPDPSQPPPPKDPRLLNPAIRDDLRAVLEIAIAVEPGHRYPTALAFAEDLRRLCEFEPVLARPASRWLRARRWCRRRRRALAVLGAAAVLLMVTVWVVVADRLAAVIHAAQQDVLQARALAGVDPPSALGVAMAAWAESPDDLANTTAIEALAHDHLRWEVDTRSPGKVTDWSLLGNGDAVHDRGSRHVAHRPVLAVAGALVCLATSLSAVEVREVATGKVVARHQCDVEVSTAAPGAGEDFFVVAADGSTSHWQRGDGFTPWRCAAPALVGQHLLSVTAVPGGRHLLLLVTREGGLVLWDPAAAMQLFVAQHPLDGSPAAHVLAVCSADGEWLVTGFGRPCDHGGALFPRNRELRVWNLTGGVLEQVIPLGPSRINSLEFAPDAQALAVASEGGDVALFDCRHRCWVFSRVWPGEAFQVRFHPDGRHLVACFAGGRRDLDPELVAAPIRVLDCADGHQVAATSGHQLRGVMAMAFSPDGQWFASGGNDSCIAVRRAANLTGEPEHVLSMTLSLPTAVQWCDDNRTLFAVDGAGVGCWDGQQAAVLVLRHHQAVSAACFTADGAHIVTGTADGKLQLWNRSSAALERRLPDAGAQVAAVVCTADDHWLLVLTDSQRLLLIDARDWSTMVELSTEVTCIALDGDSRRLAFGHRDGRVAVAELATRAITTLGRHESVAASAGAAATNATVGCVAFDVVGEHLVTGGGDRSVCLWDAGSGRLLQRGTARAADEPAAGDAFDQVLAVMSVGDGRWLVSTQAPSLLVWDPGRAMTNLRPGARISRLALHPRGDLVALGAAARTVSLLRWPEREIVAPTSIGAGMVSALQFGRTGRFLLAANYDGVARLLRTDSTPRRWAMLTGHRGPILAAALSGDERWAVTASADGTARVWPTDPIAFCQEVGLHVRRPTAGAPTAAR